jgi:hypothetical protein
MDQRGIYGPSKKTKTPLAMQAKVDPAAKMTLECDTSSCQSQREVRKCYEWGSPDHIKSNCPKLQKSPSRSSYQISGLLSQENDKVDKLIKDEIATLKLADVSDSAKHEITYKGKIVAKFCKRCKRFLKGDKAHFTADHKRKTDNPTPSASNGSTAGSTISTLSSGSPPTANLATEANVAALDPAPPLTPALMRCEAVDYNTPVLQSTTKRI